MKKILAMLIFVMPVPAAMAQIVLAGATNPGDISMMAFTTMPGAGEVHPVITLKDRTACDMTSPICMAKAEIDFGDAAWQKYREFVRRLAAVQ